ncbi:dienelactone hydrolase family protein [Sorangium sp. So ce590]|uniref:dienelactone hydrolase family protein n=1 Tax=Sorangium sp. So ce590 TaxID=3133317 RepID=UPI003F646FF9
MSRATVTLKTRDGQTEASVFRPDAGKGPWPAVLVYQDGRGIRPALFELGERIAQGGYFVLLPDLFYRGGPYQAPDAETFTRDPEFRKQWQQKYIATATKANVRSDTEAFLAFLAAEPDVRSLSIGTTGYCMGGGLSLSAAGQFPDRVIAAASYHGGNLATDDPESPHLLAPRVRARVYVAGAVEDASFPDQQKQRLSDALEQAGVQHTVETYAGAKHGWVPSDSAVYNEAASERHYQTLLALFDATLKAAAPKS